MLPEVFCMFKNLNVVLSDWGIAYCIDYYYYCHPHYRYGWKEVLRSRKLLIDLPVWLTDIRRSHTDQVIEMKKKGTEHVKKRFKLYTFSERTVNKAVLKVKINSRRSYGAGKASNFTCATAAASGGGGVVALEGPPTSQKFQQGGPTPKSRLFHLNQNMFTQWSQYWRKQDRQPWRFSGVANQGWHCQLLAFQTNSARLRVLEILSRHMPLIYFFIC